MHTVELLEEAMSVASQAGIKIRQEWFGGTPAGACEVKGRPWVFLDLSLSHREQLEQVLDGLRSLPGPLSLAISPRLQALLNARRAA